MAGDGDIDESGMSFKELLGRYPWRAIRNCPGRYALAMECCSGPPEELGKVITAEIKRWTGVAKANKISVQR